MKAVALLVVLALTGLAQRQLPPPPTAPRTAPAGRPAAPAKQPPPDLTLGLAYPEFPAFRLPAGERFQLASGLTVHVSANTASPGFYAYLLIKAGDALSPPEKVGLATITARALRAGGTRALAGNLVEEKLGQLGASLTATATETWTTVSLSSPALSWRESLALLAAVVTEPAFESDTFDAIRGDLRSRVGMRNLDARQIAIREFQQALYGAAHPLGRRIEYEHLDNIGREDVIEFYETAWTPAGAVLVIDSGIAAGEVKSEVQKLWSAWNAPRAKPPVYAPVDATPARGVFFADKRDARRSVIVLGFPGGKLSDSDVAASLVAATLLAGSPTSLLQTQLERKPSWQTQAAARWLAGDVFPGRLEVQLHCNPPFTTDLLRLALEQLETLRTTAFTPGQVRDAAEFFQMQLAASLQAPGALVVEVERLGLFGLAANYLLTLQQQLHAVTPADVQRVAQSWKKDVITVSVAGSATLFDRPLADAGLPVTLVDLSIPPPRPIEPLSDAESLSRGRQWLDRMQQAIGELKRLQQINDMVYRSEGKLWLSGAVLPVKETSFWLAPETLRQEQEFPHGRFTVYYDGKLGWIHRPNGLSALPPSMVRQARDEIFQLPFRLALSNHLPNRVVCSLGANIVQITDDRGQGVRLFLDERTALPARVIYLSEEGPNRSVMVEQTWSEWKEFDGIRMPSRVTVKHNGRKFAESAVDSIRFNTGLNPRELGRKP